MRSSYGWRALRLIVALASSCVVLWCAFMAANAILLHGFAVNCSDGHPEFDPAICGVTWQPGLPYLLVGMLGLLTLVASAWQRAFTRGVLMTAGLTSASLAFWLLWMTTWEPVNPSHPEPAGPQLVLLTVGVAAVLLAVAFPPLRSGARYVAPRHP